MASSGVGTLKSASINGVELYFITSKSYIAPWVLAEKKYSLCQYKGYQRRLGLILDLRFEMATTTVKETPDWHYVIASGIYKNNGYLIVSFNGGLNQMWAATLSVICPTCPRKLQRLQSNGSSNSRNYGLAKMKESSHKISAN